MLRIRMTIALVVLAMAPVAVAELTVPAFIGDHMMLQRNAEAPIWGWADPGARVSVSITGQTAEATAGADGRWQATLSPMPAGTGHVLSIKSGEEALEFKNVAVGEVWICSGQSNMEWTVSNSNDANKEIAGANYPEIRLFMVQRTTADDPKTDVVGSWAECSSESVPGFSAVGYFFGRKLYQELGIPIGLIKTAWGGTPADAWTSREKLEACEVCMPTVVRWDEQVANYPTVAEKHNNRVTRWKEDAHAAVDKGERPSDPPKAPTNPHTHPHRPASLYNGMIAPLVPYAFQGAIWYQGESNAGRAHQYRTLFPAMIEDWREKWGKDFPFYWVQLANFRERLEAPAESDWAELREAQSMTLKLPNTGEAVIIDIGEADDIHPRNKQDVGYRLAVNALANTYGQEVAPSGPRYAHMSVEGNAIRIGFEHIHGGLVAPGGEVRGFAIAGEDKQFVWAKATIDGDTIVVSADGVANPVSVRYGWANNPDCNLYNKAGLPASPFRTDDWPGITVGKN